MLKLLLRKAVRIVIIFLVVTIVTYCLTYFSPSDPAEVKLSKTGVMATEELLEATRKEMGLDRPLLIQYTDWLTGVVQGDFGTSYQYNRPVMGELLEALPKTIFLTLLSILLVILFSIPLGILCARKKDGLFDNAMRLFSYFFVSMPVFVTGLLFLYILCVKLSWFTVTPSPGIKSYIMPALVLSLSLSGWYIRQVRAIVLGELPKDYVTASWAKGVRESRILFQHVLKNSLLPIITLMGTSFATLLGGTTIVENIFSIPGIGKLAIEAISNRDYPMIQGYVVWMAIIFLVINYLIDLSYGIIDPRIRKQKEVKV